MPEPRSGADVNPPRFLLVVGSDAPISDPAWDQIEAAIRRLHRDRSVSLVKDDRSHVRADGTRAMYTIVWYETAQSPPLLIGRRLGGRRRGKATLAGRRVLVSALENWAADGIEVFRSFHDGRPISVAFDLRNPRTEYSDDEIRRLLFGDATGNARGEPR
jgi:hypothetical protein